MPPAARKTPARRAASSNADFIFESSVGTITVPSLAVAPQPSPLVVAEIIDEYDDQRAQAKMNLLMLRTAAGDEMYALLRQLMASELTEFTDKWSKHSGVSLGEFRAS